MTAINLAVEQELHHSVVITDVNQPDNPIIYCNGAFEVLTGRTQEELIGQDCRCLQGKDTDPACVTKLRNTIAEDRTETVILRNYHKDKSEFWNEITVSPIKDVTDQFRWEESTTRLGVVLEASNADGSDLISSAHIP